MDELASLWMTTIKIELEIQWDRQTENTPSYLTVQTIKMENFPPFQLPVPDQNAFMFTELKSDFKTPNRPTKPTNLAPQKRKIQQRFKRRPWIRKLFPTETKTFRIVSRYKVGDYCPELDRVITSPRDGFIGQLTVIQKIVIAKGSSLSQPLSTQTYSYWSM